MTQDAPRSLDKSALQHAWDFVGIPFRLVLFDQKWLPHFNWTTLEDDRLAAVLPWCKGRLLDVGAGPNTLVKRWGDGVGVDVVDWGGGALVVEDSSKLPFEPASFDTVTFVACLNHVPNREDALREAFRVLRPGGRLIITMINPVLGGVGHAIWWYSEDKHRDVHDGEVGGIWSWEVKRMARRAGFRTLVHKRFVYGMNNLLVFERPEVA